MSASNSDPTLHGHAFRESQTHKEAESVHVVLEFDIDLSLLRKQKRALIGISEGATVAYEQEEAAEGLLNLIDFIQDSIVEQGLATEEEVFPRPPQLFGEEGEPAARAF